MVAWVAGFVDAVGYLTLFGLFTAHMSGNTVDVGLALGSLNWASALFRFTPILGFVLGVGLGAALLELTARRGIKALVAVILCAESLLLAAYAIGATFWLRQGAVWRPTNGAFYLLAALLTLAMGLQNTTLRRVGKQTIRTTYVTGMLTDTTIEAVKYLFWFGDRLRQPGARRLKRLKRMFAVTPRQSSFNRSRALALIWVLYVVGAVAGTVGELRLGTLALVAPVVVLLAIVGIDLWRPIYPDADAARQAK